MPKSAIEQELVKAFAGLNPALKRMILPAFEADLAARPRPREADRLRLLKLRPAAAAGPAAQLDELRELAPHDYQEFCQEIARRVILVRRARAARINWAVEKPWPWPLFYAVRQAPGASAAARILVTVLGITDVKVANMAKLAGVIRSADQRSARIILSNLLGAHMPTSTAEQFEREA